MNRNEKLDANTKITTTTDYVPKDKAEDSGKMRAIHLDSGTIYKPKEAPSECNPDNGAWFEERSNPLSSKGN